MGQHSPLEPRPLLAVFLPLAVVFLAIGTLPALLPDAVAAQEDVEVTEERVEAELDPRADRAVAARLEALFAATEATESVRAEVRSGVARLAGTVDSVAARELAVALAERVEGVVAIDDQIQESRSVAQRLRVAADRVRERGWGLVEALPIAGLALLLVGAAFLLARAVRRLEGPFRWVSDNPFVRDLGAQLAGAAILLAGVLGALELLDATALVGAVLGAAGVFGLAVGFAFRDLVENYLASLLLGIRRPFAPQDHVRIEGHEGLVLRLTSRATVLVTLDGNHVRIPNATVFKAVIENFTRNPSRRFAFDVGVSTEAELSDALDLALGVVSGSPGVLADPAPQAAIAELGDSNVVLRVLAWIDQRDVDFFKSRGEAIRRVKEAFDAESVEMPEPITRVRLETPDAPSAGADRPRGNAPEHETARDVSPDRGLDHVVEEETRQGGDDLLVEAGREE